MSEPQEPKRMRTRPVEIPPDQQLKTIMTQIAELTGAEVHQPEDPPAPRPTQFKPEPPPETANSREAKTPSLMVFEDVIESQPSAPGIRLWSLVQIKDVKSESFGTVFTVSDIQGDMVHGFLFTPGRNRVYVSAARGICEIVGSGMVGSRQPRSPEWTKEFPNAAL